MAMLFFMRDYFIKYNPKYCIMSKFITNNLQVIPIRTDGKYDENDISDYRSFFMDEAIKLMEL